jgi:hypothetical protein
VKDLDLAAARQRDVGGSGTVRECADAHAFESHRRANVRVFVLGRGRRDDSVDSIVVVGSGGIARGDVHRGCRCATTNDDDGDANANDIVC